MIRISGGSCENSKNPSGSTKFMEILDWLENIQLLKRDSVPKS
jgi:hypothetical protein